MILHYDCSLVYSLKKPHFCLIFLHFSFKNQHFLPEKPSVSPLFMSYFQQKLSLNYLTTTIIIYIGYIYDIDNIIIELLLLIIII